MEKTEQEQDRIGWERWDCKESNWIRIYLIGKDWFGKDLIGKDLIGKDFIELERFVKTPTKTSIRLKTTSSAVGFDTIMTVHTTPPPPHHPTQELYSRPGKTTRLCKLTQS